MTKPVYWSPLSFAQSLRVISWVRQWDIDKFINVYNKFFRIRKWRVQIWILGYGCQIKLSNICLFIIVRIFYLSKSINYTTNLFSKTWRKNNRVQRSMLSRIRTLYSMVHGGSVSPLTSITIISGATIYCARLRYRRDKKIATIRNNNNCKKLLQLKKIIELMLGFLVLVW